MRKARRIWVVLLAAALFAAACARQPAQQPAGQQPPAQEPAAPKLRVALVLNGTLGDKSFFDSAARGVEKAGKELGVQYKIIEASYEPSEWEPALRDAAASGEYDLVIAGTWQMLEHMQTIAPQFPAVKFVIFDVAPEKPEDVLPNVNYILYSQSEGSFLAGAFAAMATTHKDLALANPAKKIGFLGGMNIPVINDFLEGYKQGAAYIDPEVEVLVSYAETFADPAKGKEISLAQYGQGADIIFNVAGGTGLGLIEAAREAKRYAIGVDSNQNFLQPGHVLTSMLKNVDNSLYRVISLTLEGKFPGGKAEVLGIREGGVGLAKDELYDQYVPADVKARMDEIEQQILDGVIKVRSLFGG